MKKKGLTILLGMFLTMSLSTKVQAWSEHPLLAHQVLSRFPELVNAPAVEVRELKTFLIKNEKAIEKALAAQEAWAQANMPWYDPLPAALVFKATGNEEDILIRFFHAIRLNPNVKMRLYLHLIPGESIGDFETYKASDLTTVSNVSEMQRTIYRKLTEGETVSPLSVLVTANDEPDYGFDLGLYEDNNTPHGKIYGLGKQPFGDPNLEYGSQAPFHMGFYHEAGLIFKFGAFLRKTYPEYRIQLFKTLSEMAFEQGEDYWGYRFMGYGMHYLGDLSMPYHTAPLPGTSTLKMLWINLKAMIGFPGAKDRAVQLVSNKHSVFERFQWLELRKAYEENNMNHPMIQALRKPVEMIPYSDKFPAQVAAINSVDISKKVDKALRKWVPKKLVRDAKFEAPGSAELEDLLGALKQYKGQEAIDNISQVIAERFSNYSMHLESYYRAIKKKS